MFRRVFGVRWRDQAEDPRSRDTWLAGLRVLRLTDDLVRNGLSKSLPLEWPPSLGEFAKLCRSGSWPDQESGMREAVRWAVAHVAVDQWDWSHAVVCAAARSVGTWNLRQMPEADLRRVWAHAYGIAAGQALRGEVVEPPPRALPAKSEIGVRTPEGQAAGLQMLRDAMRRYFGS